MLFLWFPLFPRTVWRTVAHDQPELRDIQLAGAEPVRHRGQPVGDDDDDDRAAAGADHVPKHLHKTAFAWLYAQHVRQHAQYVADVVLGLRHVANLHQNATADDQLCRAAGITGQMTAVRCFHVQLNIILSILCAAAKKKREEEDEECFREASCHSRLIREIETN